MSARIAKGNARSRPRASSGRGRKPVKQGLFEQMGIAPEAVRRVSWWIFLGVAAAVAIAAIAFFRVPQMIGTAAGESIGRAGFAVQRIEIRGLQRMQRLPVYSVALDQQSMAMPLVDLDGIRERLLRFGWVAEARVSRRLPDTLVVDIVERQPAAIWQNERRLMLIDRHGVVLEQVRLEAMPQLPLVIGPAANLQATSLNALLDAAPHLRPQIEGATWVGGRRWDLRFQSGEVVALPEGDDLARRAIVHFARMDQHTQLLGRGFVRFDLRDPGRMVVRVSREPGSRVPSITPDAPASGSSPASADLSNTI